MLTVQHGALFFEKDTTKVHALLKGFLANTPQPSIQAVVAVSWLEYLQANSEGVSLHGMASSRSCEPASGLVQPILR
jgi:hypothetical protein